MMQSNTTFSQWLRCNFCLRSKGRQLPLTSLLLFIAFSFLLLAPSKSVAEMTLAVSVENFPAQLTSAIQAYLREDTNRCEQEVEALTHRVEEARGTRTELGALSRAGEEKILLIQGLCRYQAKNYSEALFSLERALELRPAFNDAQFLRGLVLGHMDRHSDAVAAYREVLWFSKLTLAPVIFVKRELAEQLEKLGRHEEALLVLTEASNGITDLEILVPLIEAFLSDGNRAEAIRVARIAIAAHPEQADLNTLLAEALLLNVDRALGGKDIAEAKALVADRALKANELTRPVSVYIRATTALGELAAARTVLGQTKKLSGATPEFQAALAQLKIEEAAAKQNSDFTQASPQ